MTLIRAEPTLKDKIQWAKASSGPAFRGFNDGFASALPQPSEEQLERRAAAARAAEGMLGDARSAAAAQLKEALRTGDAELAAECRSALRSLSKLPEGIKLDEAPPRPDFKRWLDPNSLR